MAWRFLLVPGSLRAGSTNAAVLRTVQAMVPAGVEGELYDGLGELPAFNPDDDGEVLPPPVRRLRAAIDSASAIVFSTPEYAAALPGSFKNLLDWTIGDAQPGSIYEKPVAWINASSHGAHAAHDELRRVLQYAHATIVESACVEAAVTAPMVGPDGLIHELAIRDQLAYVLSVLAEYVGYRPPVPRTP